MTVPTAQLRERGLVPHPFRGGAERNQEEFELVPPRMAQHIRTLRERWVQGPQKDQGELLSDLAFGTRAAQLAAFAGFDEPQRVGGVLAGRDVKGLPDHVAEVFAREPLQLCHEAIVSALAHASRTDT